MEELNLVFEHAIFVKANGRIGGLAGNVFKKWVNCDSLHEFSVAFKCLYFSELILCNAP
jgi:hypothetical protein